MKDYKVYTSPITEKISDWLLDIPPSLQVQSDNIFQQNLDNVIARLGYGAPFDVEQRAINDMLKAKRAGKIACAIAWGYYHDYKFAETRNMSAAAA